MEFNVGFRDLRELVSGFEAYGFSRKGAINWCRENSDIINQEFMKDVYANPDGFFYYESHLKEDFMGLECLDLLD